MRRRILRVALIAIVLAVVVTGVPAAIATAGVVSAAERSELQALALRTALRVGPAYRQGDPIELPTAEQGTQLGVYDPEGMRRAGTGPRNLEPATHDAVQSGPVSVTTAGQLVELVPVGSGEQVIGSVRVASPTSIVRSQIAEWWLALAGSALFALACAGVYAAREARRLSRPIDQLTNAVVDLGAGDFDADPGRSGVPEIDKAGRALRRTADRLADLVDRERAFTTRASHQLRTPLTQIQLSLESGLEGRDHRLREAVEQALITADTLSDTIDDVLSLAREDPGRAALTSPGPVTGDVAGQWRGALAEAGRRLELRVAHTPDVPVPAAVLRQVLTTLLDNAFRHGSGTVSVTVRSAYEAVAIDVRDEGTGAPIDLRKDSGLGLSLAITLTERAGGRLLVDRQGGTRFTLLLPAAAGGSEPPRPHR